MHNIKESRIRRDINLSPENEFQMPVNLDIRIDSFTPKPGRHRRTDS